LARDWEVSNTLADLKARMARFGVNVAPVPISMVEEYDPGRGMIWVVDIHIKVYRKTEFDISVEGKTLSEALRRAYLGLNNELGLLERADRANRVFEVAV
jgi:hypothetical protein